MTAPKSFIKTHIVQQKKLQWQIITVNLLFFIYKKVDATSQLTKKTTKIEKFEENLKMYIVNSKIIRYKLTAWGKSFHFILNYKLMRPVSILRLAKEQKRESKSAISWKKNWAKKLSKAIKMNFSENSFLLSIIFWSNGILFNYITSKNHNIWTNLLEPRNFWENS